MSEFWWGYIIGVTAAVLGNVFITPHVERYLLKRWPKLASWIGKETKK